MRPHRLLTQFQDDLRTAGQAVMPEVFRTVLARMTSRTRASFPEALTDEDRSLFAAGIQLASEINQEDQHAYHNRIHAAEVLWAVSALWQAERERLDQAGDPPLANHDALVLLVAMTAHDLGHPGLWASERVHGEIGAIERHSAIRTSVILAKNSVPPATIQQVSQLIESTEPVRGVPKAQRTWIKTHQIGHLWPVLAGEADILGSLWHSTGPLRGQRLSEERALAGQGQTPTVGSWAGRGKFLQAVSESPHSPAFIQLGLPTWVGWERQVIEKHGTTWDSLPFGQTRMEHQHQMEAISYEMPAKYKPC